MKPEATEADDAKVQEYAKHVGGLTRWESEKLRTLFALHRNEAGSGMTKYWDADRYAMRLAADRLEMLLEAGLPESDHPTATRHVLSVVNARLTQVRHDHPSHVR